MDAEVLAAVTNAKNPIAYGAETYWGRKFIYRSLDGRVVVITVLPANGQPYDDHGGQPRPVSYPSLPAILDVVDQNGLVNVPRRDHPRSARSFQGRLPHRGRHGRAAPRREAQARPGDLLSPGKSRASVTSRSVSELSTAPRRRLHGSRAQAHRHDPEPLGHPQPLREQSLADRCATSRRCATQGRSRA